MPQFVDNSIAPLMISISAFDDPGLEFNGLKRIANSQHEEFKGSHVEDGDLLVAMGGYAGKAAICPPGTPKANIGRHTAKVSVDELKADRYYIWAFIRSRIGILQFERYVTGSVQAGINLEDIRKIHITSPTLLAQKYIGDKVRQAEQLRAWAKNQKLIVNQIIDDLDLPYNQEPEMINMINTKILMDRLDPRPYRTHCLNLVDSIKKLDHSSLADCVSMFSG